MEQETATAPEKTETKRGHLLITCGACGASQSEPKSFVSTFCKGCGAHIEAGAEQSAQNAPSPKVSHIEELAKNGGANPEPEAPIEESPPSLLERLQLKQSPPPPREIECLKCGHNYSTSPSSENCQCPQCGTYLHLGDIEVRTTRNSNIETGGNVIVHKEGKLQCSSVSCHNLTIVDGTYRGRVRCSGRFHFRGTAKILGSIQCDELIIEEESTITCFQTVRAGEATILGDLAANLICKGTVRIGNVGTLQGDVVAGAVQIDPGGSLDGNMEIHH